MATDGSMLSADEDVQHIAEPTDRRPEFCAEGLSRGFRVGLLGVSLLAIAALFFALAAMALWPAGVFEFGDLFGAMFLGGLLGLSFFVFLVFGALLGNNPHVDSAERATWYVLLAFAGAVAIPAYWLIHVWPAPFEPLPRAH
jgi:hypothetical protein